MVVLIVFGRGMNYVGAPEISREFDEVKHPECECAMKRS